MIFRKPKARNQHTPIADELIRITIGEHPHSRTGRIEGLALAFNGDGDRYDYQVVLDEDDLALIDKARQMLRRGRHKRITFQVIDGSLVIIEAEVETNGKHQ